MGICFMAFGRLNLVMCHFVACGSLETNFGFNSTMQGYLLFGM